MNKTTLIIGIIFFVFIILLVVLNIVIKNKKKKSIINTLDKLNTEKNLIISSTLITELDKAEKLANNKKLASEVETWKKRFDEIEKVDLPSLTDELVEAETLCMNKDYDEANTSLLSAEKDIFSVKAKSIKLLNEIKDLTESEERNRETITKLKSTYREIIFKYNKHKSDYNGVSSPIELQFENIDKLFSAFEVAVQKKNYEEFGRIVKALDDMISNINIEAIGEERDPYKACCLNVEHAVARLKAEFNEHPEVGSAVIEGALYDIRTGEVIWLDKEEAL